MIYTHLRGPESEDEFFGKNKNLIPKLFSYIKIKKEIEVTETQLVSMLMIRNAH